MNDEPAPPSTTRRLARAAAQVVGSAVLVGLAWRGVDWGRLSEHVGEVDWVLFCVGALLLVGAPLVSSWRTWTLLSGVAGPVAYGRVARLNYGAMRFVFLPGGDVIGGVWRWYEMTRWGWSRSKALSVLLVERVLDLAIVAVVVAAVVPLWTTIEGPIRVVWTASLVLLASLAGLACLLPTLRRRFADDGTAHVAGRGRLHALRRGAGATVESVAGVLGRPAVAARVVAASFAYWGVALLGGSLLARGLTAGLDVGGYLLTQCVVALAAQLPISVAGVGLREATMRVLMARHGVTPEQAVLVGVGALVPYALAACVGVFVAWRGERS